MTQRRGFKLNEKKNGDVEIFRFLYEYRRATIDHLCLLTGRERSRLNRRLKPLAEHGYVYRTRKHTDDKYIYTIRQQVIPILVKHGVVGEEALDQRIRWHERTDYFREHNIGVTDIHVSLELASRKSPIKLVDWREGKEIEDTVIVYAKGERKSLSVKPDGFFTLCDTRRPEGRNMADYFLEYDRFSTSKKRWQDKITRFVAYFEQGRHQKKYGIKRALVVTIGLDTERTKNRCLATGEVVPRDKQRDYYFAAKQVFSFEKPERVFDAIFMTPRDYQGERRYYFIPPLDKS